MGKTISINLPDNLQSELDDVCRAEGVSESEIVEASLRDYLLLRQFRNLRQKFVVEAQKKGIFTDQDVFDRVS